MLLPVVDLILAAKTALSGFLAFLPPLGVQNSLSPHSRRHNLGRWHRVVEFQDLL